MTKRRRRPQLDKRLAPYRISNRLPEVLRAQLDMLAENATEPRRQQP